MSTKPLQDIKVLDLTWVYAGPFATMLLADLGAEVIKVEGPPNGDWTRVIPPFKNGQSGYFYMLNRRKKSIAIDLKQQKGIELFLDLVEHFDVLTENFKAGTLDKLGLGYEQVKEVNPKIIYASITGFGSSGPYSDMPCVDPVAQAMGGLMSVTGFPGQPIKTGPAVADSLSGMYLALGIVSALRLREKTGTGTKLEVSMMDSVFSVLEESVIRASITGSALPARGNTDPLGAPWDTFKTKDNRFIMICNLDASRFHEIYNLIGRWDIAEEYKGNDKEADEKRSKDLDKLNSIFADWAKTKTAEEIQHIMLQFSVPVGVVKEVTELLDDPQLKHQNMIADIDHPVMEKIKTFNLPIKFVGNEMGIKPGENPLDPKLGEQTFDVFKTILGLDKSELEVFKKEKVLWA